jgi:hypothetical protein
LGIVGKLFAVLTALVLALIAYGIYLEWNVKRWDARIDALCAANGGRDVALRLYETAVAPETKEYFAENRLGRSLVVPSRRDGEALGARIPYVLETRVVEVIRSKNPSVVKFTERIVRVSDNKHLAERFGYQRSGGGIPTPDPTTNYRCPDGDLKNSLHFNVFLNHPMKAIGASK